MRAILLPAQRYVHTSQTGGLVLMASAAVALLVANSPLAPFYEALWDAHLIVDLRVVRFDMDVAHWINDGLMTLFFLVVGLEVKREIAAGELSSARKAALPAFAALGGMVVPAGAYLLMAGAAAARGWGVPVATDIAFALGVLALAGRRVPVEARTLLLALAAVDDIGGILVIGLFYSSEIAWLPLVLFGLLVGVAGTLNALGIRHLFLYMATGVAAWAALMLSGIHPTLAGVVFGLLAPARPDFEVARFARQGRSLIDRLDRHARDENLPAAASVLGEIEELTRGTEPPVERIERVIHPWVSFFVLPLFALANAGLPLSGESLQEALESPAAHGVALALLVGKPIGVFGASWLAVRTGLAQLPESVGWAHVAGLALLAGIGFTVSLFIAELAFGAGSAGEAARIAILAASVLSAAAGYVWLRRTSEASADAA
ncbi:MAG: Na+/H+ antiporter NhaA [Vicinamibacterales bacterium]